MRVKIEYIECGELGYIIDCNTPRLFCPFCKNWNVTFSETKEITPKALYDLLKHNYNKIISTV